LEESWGCRNDEPGGAARDVNARDESTGDTKGGDREGDGKQLLSNSDTVGIEGDENELAVVDQSIAGDGSEQDGNLNSAAFSST
jgi:hypothetical protein